MLGHKTTLSLKVLKIIQSMPFTYNRIRNPQKNFGKSINIRTLNSTFSMVSGSKRNQKEIRNYLELNENENTVSKFMGCN